MGVHAAAAAAKSLQSCPTLCRVTRRVSQVRGERGTGADSHLGFPCGSAGKDAPAMRETWVPSLGREESPGEGKGYPLQYSGLENPWTVQSMGLQSRT